jgi:glutamate---cysteine ligase / carboxylate-amine ligase
MNVTEPRDGFRHRAAGPLTIRADSASFGTEPPFALGVEEELLLVDAGNELLDRGRQAVRAVEAEDGAVDRELFKAMVELQSDVSASAGEAVDQLRGLRRQLLESGSRLMGAGLHPTAAVGEAAVDRAPRYALIADSLRGILRTPICGLHIHVGVPDEETAVRAYNGIRAHVPLINALAANSPYWFGEDSGLASSRTVIFRSYPRAAMAPEASDFDHYCRIVDQVCTAAGLDDYTHIWWDVRIHPNLGTIEIRAADAQFDLRRVSALAALVHCLVRAQAEAEQCELPAREALAESSFQATRYGLQARLLDRRGHSVPAQDLGRRTLETAATAADELGCGSELEYVTTMLETGPGADLQRRAHDRGGMPAVLAFLVEETGRLRQEGTEQR